MKKILFALGIIAAVLSSCERDIYPHARFTVNYDLVQPGEIVEFTSHSSEAKYYNWDFGDGYSSDAVHPTHYYDYEGIYTVTLTVESRDGHIDRTQLEIEVVYTELQIEVVEWHPEEYVVPGALVILYETLWDWDNDGVRYAEGYADGNGEITFYGNLQEKVYYVFAQRYDYPNHGDLYDNLDMPSDYIRTYTLVPFALNFWTCWVDYYPAKSKTIRDARTAIKPEDSSKPSRVFVKK